MFEEKFNYKLPFGLIEHEQNSILALINSHPAVDYPEPLTPNTIEVGGLQIQEPLSLPKVSCCPKTSAFVPLKFYLLILGISRLR